MNKGKIVQVGTPPEIYSNPINTFCASFVGESNLFKTSVVEMEAVITTVEIGNERISTRSQPNFEFGQACSVLIRPEVLSVYQVDQAGRNENELHGEIHDTIFLGSSVFYHIEVGAPSLLLVEEHVKEGQHIFQREERVIVGWSANDTLLLKD
ncbi:MAG: TOBE domain-containing protein [Anaerolineales bacterium]|nr:TOBE domain-containing protein [Anaerolineales bacterium]